MKKDFLEILTCPKCKNDLRKVGNNLICKKNHKYQIKSGVPVMAEINYDLGEEAKAWEDEWKKGVSKKALKAYEKNMRIFRKIGLWEEAGEATKNIPTQKNWTILDLGCGNGVSTANLKGSRVVGIDLSLKQMIRAKRKFSKKNFAVADATKLPFKSNTFDMILAINLLHHLSDETEKGLNECYRVLKKGGMLITVDPNLTNPFGFTARGLYRLLKLKRTAPTFPQFALQDDEYQFTKDSYYKIFENSSFKNSFKIIPHRIERITFFSSIIIPAIADLPFYETMVRFFVFSGNVLVKLPLIDRLCYFWKGEAIKA